MRRKQQQLDFLHGKGFGQRAAEPGQIDGAKRIVREVFFAHKKVEKRFQRRDSSGVGSFGKLLFSKTQPQVSVNRCFVYQAEVGDFFGFGKIEKKTDVG